MKIRFTESDLTRIKAAVEEAESRTSGEIVPYVVDQSDRYDVAFWRGACLFGITLMGLTLLFLQLYDGWGFGWLHTMWGPSVVTIGGALIGALLVWMSQSVRRALCGSSLLARSVHQRAVRAFVEEEVFKTRDRTGILLFLSLFEHRIEVLGDEGINRAVEVSDWIDVVQTVQRGIKEGRVTEGLVEAIRKCGVLLETHGVAIRPDDTDELSNQLRIRSDE